MQALNLFMFEDEYYFNYKNLEPVCISYFVISFNPIQLQR